QDLRPQAHRGDRPRAASHRPGDQAGPLHGAAAVHLGDRLIRRPPTEPRPSGSVLRAAHTDERMTDQAPRFRRDYDGAMADLRARLSEVAPTREARMQLVADLLWERF